MGNEEFEVFAKKMGEYIMESYVLPWLRTHGVVQCYRATVVSVDSVAGTMTVQRPFDNAITIPYCPGAAGLTAGDQCTVLVLGDAINSIVISDGKLSTL